MNQEYLEDWQECLGLLGIKGFKPTRPQWLFLEASCTDLLERHPNKSWWFRHKRRLRGELLFVLNELGPVLDEEIDRPEQHEGPIPLFEKTESQSKDSDGD